MKWPIIIFGLLSTVPLAWWLRRNEEAASKIWILVGALAFFVSGFGLTSSGIDRLYAAFISWPLWSGHTKGLEISLLDLIIFSLWLSLPKREYAVPLKFSLAVYLAAIFFASLDADPISPSLFYVWQVARVALLFVVTVRACRDDRVPTFILQGMAFAMTYEACYVFVQRFAWGQLQPSGTFPHQNTLGIVEHFALYPAFMLALAGYKVRWTLSIAVLGAITAVLTASRATIGLLALGLSLSLLLSTSRGWTVRKASMYAVCIFLAPVIAIMATSSLERRFQAAPIAEDIYDERAAFEASARNMIQDYPWGVGSNHFVMVANNGGYYIRNGVAPHAGSLSGHVHNYYLLVRAETGPFGLGAMLFIMLYPLVIAFWYGLGAKVKLRGDILLGLGVSLLIVYLQAFVEWVHINFAVQYIWAISAGVIAGVVQSERKLIGQQQRRRRRVTAGAALASPIVSRQKKQAFAAK